MAKQAKLKKLKSIFETLGIIAVLVSLILLWQEMRQNRILSEISFEMTITQNRIMANQTITNNADIWARGCADDSLSLIEKVVFNAMIEDRNELAYYRVNRYYNLDDERSAKVIQADFIGFLHKNPGARKVWKNHEEEIISNRKLLNVNLVDYWYDIVIEGLEKLDEVNAQEQ